MNLWISAADRLPADLTPVVAWVENPEGSGPCVARWNVVATTWEMQVTMNWKDDLWSPFVVKVTHWAELPPEALS